MSTYVGYYMTSYAITSLGFAPKVAMVATVVSGLSTLVFSIAGGWLADRYGRRAVMLYPRVLAGLLTYPAFMFLVDVKTPEALFGVTLFLGAMTALSGAATLVAIPELFPKRIRSLGMSIAYAIGVALFGGTTQFVITWLISVTGDPMSPAIYVTFTSVIAIVGMYLLPESYDKTLED